MTNELFTRIAQLEAECRQLREDNLTLRSQLGLVSKSDLDISMLTINPVLKELSAPVHPTVELSTDVKIQLFRSLFKGREDVYSVRWDSKNGRSGYAPACDNEWLSGVQAEKVKLVAEGKIKKEKPLEPIGEDEKPFELPHSWEWAKLEYLMPEFQNGASSRGDANGDSVIVLRLADINDRCISLKEPRELLISPNMIDKYRLSIGDILIVRVNGSADLVGGFVLCDQLFDGIYCDHFIRMRLSQSILNYRFLALVGASHLVRDRIKDLFITTAGQKTVNQGHIGSLVIPLLSIEEQHRIVVKVDALMTICDQLKIRIQQANQQQQTIANVLVAQAVD